MNYMNLAIGDNCGDDIIGGLGGGAEQRGDA